MFCTVRQSFKFNYDNATVAMVYTDTNTGQTENCYGRIGDIFTHSIPAINAEGEEISVTRTIISCQWYETVTNEPSPSLLVTVVRNEAWDDEDPYMFLEDAWARTLTMLPKEGPFQAHIDQETRFVIIPHHELH